MTRPLRILLVGDYPADPRLGSSKVSYKLQEEFIRLGHQCDMMLQPDLGAWPRQAKARWAVTPWVTAGVVGRIADRYDVIEIAGAEGAGMGVRRALTPGAGYALVSRSHGLEHRNYQRMVDDSAAGLRHKAWYQRLWYPTAKLSQVEIAARLADRLIVLSAGDAEFAEARGWTPRDRIDVIAHGVSTPFLESAPAPGAPRGRGVLFCGTWGPGKGSPYLVPAFAKLLENRPDAKLTVLGPGVPVEEVLEDFDPAVRAAVTVIPRVGEAEVMGQYRTHDVLVLPSSYEGFGMVVLEAMSQRLPVIATPTGGAVGLVRNGETGLLIAPRSTDEMAAAMQRLLDDRALGRQIAETAYAMAQGYTWTRTAELTLQSYEKAVAWRRERP